MVDAPGESEYVTPTIRLGYASMLTPDSVYDYDLATGEMTLLKRPRCWTTRHSVRTTRPVTSRSGAGPPPPTVPGCRCPSSAVPTCPGRVGACRALRLRVVRGLDGPRLLDSRLSLLDRGIVYAMAHVRGGGELGRSWYEQGKMLVQDQHVHRLRGLCRLSGRRAGYTAPTGWLLAAAAPAAC